MSTMTMRKRPADGEISGFSSPKRLIIETSDAGMMEDPDFDPTTPQSPASSIDAESTVTAATTPRAKFPSDLKTLACTWPGCPKTFNRPARLRDHLNSHTNSRPFKCPYDGCDKDYIEDKHLKQHIKGSHTLERKHVCPREGCGKSFATGTRLKRHQAVHDGADRFRCQDCGQSFRKRDTLNTHIRKEHLKVQPFQCAEPDCTAAFETKASLRRHRDREHGQLRFWCLECASRSPDGSGGERVGFTTETLLLAHMKQEHQDCLFCDFKSASRWEMETHVEIYHSGKTVEERKTVLCPHEDCHKSFTRKSNLNQHIRSAHEGHRFICGEYLIEGPDFLIWSNDEGCGDKFSSKARLEDHIRFRHLGFERPKVSQPEQPIDPLDELSGAAYASKQIIACPSCSEVFLRYHDLDLHITRHHHSSSTSEDNGIFGDAPADVEFGGGAQWVESQGEEEIFAAGPDFSQQKDEWVDDEANIMLLAREPAAVDAEIDPALLTQ